MSIGAGIMLFSWLVARPLPAWLRWRAETVAQIQAELGATQHTRSVIAGADDTRDSFAAAARRLVRLAPDLVPGKTATDAAAALTNQLGEVALRSNVKLGAVEALRDSGSGPFHRIALRFHAEGDIRGIGHMIAALEYGRPVLRLESLDLLGPEGGISDRVEVLRLDASLVGWASFGGGQ